MHISLHFNTDGVHTCGAQTQAEQLSLLHASIKTSGNFFSYCTRNTSNNAFFRACEPFLFHDSLLADLYEHFSMRSTRLYSFAWDNASFNVIQSEAIQARIKKWMAQQHNYYEDVIDTVLDKLFGNAVNIQRYGVQLYHNIAIRVDLVDIGGNSNLRRPIIIVCDSLKRVSKTESLEEAMRRLAVMDNFWLARLKSNNTLDFNTRHPSYIRIASAMQALNADLGHVIYFDIKTGDTHQFDVKPCSADWRSIYRSSIYAYSEFSKFLGTMTTNLPIPYINVETKYFTISLNAEDKPVYTSLTQVQPPRVPWAHPPYRFRPQDPQNPNGALLNELDDTDDESRNRENDDEEEKDDDVQALEASSDDNDIEILDNNAENVNINNNSEDDNDEPIERDEDSADEDGDDGNDDDDEFIDDDDDVEPIDDDNEDDVDPTDDGDSGGENDFDANSF